MSDRFITAQKTLALADLPIATLACQFDAASYSDHLFGSHHVALPPGATGWIAKRRAGFLAGRIAARGAMALLGLSPDQVPIGPGGAPCWPDDVTGSITHSDNTAVCSVARRDQLAALGLDLETVMSAQVATQISGGIVSSAEAALLRRLPLPFEQALTIAFSAKESLYKALYPDVRSFFDFDAAELCALDPAAHTFTLRLTRTLSQRWIIGLPLSGHYQPRANTILTQIALLR